MPATLGGWALEEVAGHRRGSVCVRVVVVLVPVLQVVRAVRQADDGHYRAQGDAQEQRYPRLLDEQHHGHHQGDDQGHAALPGRAWPIDRQPRILQMRLDQHPDCSPNQTTLRSGTIVSSTL